ncbi:hypothetical protein [Gordonia polyisoprenivorans]|uniref:hypothetical protein n=1 Tax=Gordonia polyisoprenivorans TaxID=84595 RepID=UPI001054B9F1|nr:hypothetical protein [Gordonia polyisoprenivorans]
MKHKWALILGAVVAGITLAGCGGSVAPVADSPTPSDADQINSTTQETPSSSEPFAPSNVTIDRSVRTGSGVLVENCPDSLSFDRTEPARTRIPTPSIFDPQSGKFLKVPAAAIPSGAEVVWASCLPSGTAQKPSATVVLNLRTPPAGLNPEKYATQMSTFSLDDIGHPKLATLPLPDDVTAEFDTLTGTGGNILWSPDVDYDKDRITYLMKPDGTQLASFPGSQYGTAAYVDETAFVMASARGGFTSHPEAVIDGTTGKPLALDPEITSEGSSIRRLYTTADGGFIYEIENSTHSRSLKYVNIRERRVRTLGTWDYPPFFQIYGNYAVGVGRGLQVIDVASGKEILTRSEDQWERLGVKNWYVAGKYLYLKNAGDSPVVDVTTGKTVSKGWSKRPAERVIENWELVLPGEVTNGYARCLDRNPHLAVSYAVDNDAYYCHDSGSLVYSPNGYSGAWY